MPDTRDPSGTILTLPVRQLQDVTSLAMRSVAATYGLWFELLQNQRNLPARFLGAMVASTKTETQPVKSERVVTTESADVPESTRAKSTATKAAVEFPIKGYDKLTVQEIAGKLGRLRDHRQIRAVLAYEAKNKARKGVAAAGEARLEHLTASSSQSTLQKPRL